MCYKCGKIGHKAFQCKIEQKINKLFYGEPELQKKLLDLLTKDGSKSENDYYVESSEDSKYESSPILSLNVITNKTQKGFLLDLIGQIPDVDTKKDYLEKLKGIILEEEDKSFRFSPKISTITKIFE